MARKTSAVALYCVLAYAITWLGVSPLVARGLGLYGGRLPEWWHALGAAGPVTAALLTARMAGGRDGLHRWLAGVKRYRIGTRWWLVAVGSPVALLVGATLVAWAVTGAWPGAGLASTSASPSVWTGLLVVSFAYGLGEEPGWRGFLLPTLMERHSARKATLFVAVIWAAWHIPFFAYRFDFEGPATVVGFFTAMLAGAYWLTFLYLRSGGSVPAVAVWHLVWDVVNMVAAQMSDLVVGVLNALMMVLGFAVLFLHDPWARGAPDSAPATPR